MFWFCPTYRHGLRSTVLSHPWRHKGETLLWTSSSPRSTLFSVTPGWLFCALPSESLLVLSLRRLKWEFANTDRSTISQRWIFNTGICRLFPMHSRHEMFLDMYTCYTCQFLRWDFKWINALIYVFSFLQILCRFLPVRVTRQKRKNYSKAWLAARCK